MKKNFDLKTILDHLDISEKYVNQLAVNNCLIKRLRKITPINLTQSACINALTGTSSLNGIAMEIDNCIPDTISKQAVSKKMTKEFDMFLLDLIQAILSNIYNSDINIEKQKYFKRILVQDSTIVKLPFRLFKEMSGVANKTTKVANARIQVVYDLISEQFLKFEIEPYSKNDSKAAPELELKNGDLCLRDRGYLTIKEIIRHNDNVALYIYRHKFDVKYLDKDTHKPIDLLSILKNKRRIDMKVRLNASPQTVVRIVAEPVSSEIANKRIRKAKKENKNLSRDYIKMLEWSIYITNLESTDYFYQDVFQLYSLRWKIETIFKNWKSNLNFDKIHNVSYIQLKILLHVRFLVILLINNIQSLVKPIVRITYNKHISFLKLTNYISSSIGGIEMILGLFRKNTFENSKMLKILKQKCTYDERSDRINFEESLIKIFK